MVGDGKKSKEQQQNEQFEQLLKDLGITSRRSLLSNKEKKKVDDIFPE